MAVDIVGKIKSIYEIIKGLPSYYDTYNGRQSYRGEGTPDEIEKEKGAERFLEISQSPLGFAGFRFRDISKLWVSAKGADNREDGSYHPPQVIFQNEEDGEQEHLDLIRWMFDDFFVAKGMRVILSQIHRSLITYGRCVEGLNWVRTSETPFGERVLISDILDFNPAFFLKDPQDEIPGVYKKNTKYSTSQLTRMPDTLFAWGVNHMYFENPYGISEYRILDTIDKLYSLNMKYWLKANERSGTGVIVGTYGNQLAGTDDNSRTKREKFYEECRKLKSDTVTIKHAGNTIEYLQTAIESDSYRDAHEALGQLYSLVLTASTTALQEGKYGSYGKEEASVTRRASELQRLDASLIDDLFNYQIIPWVLDKNYSDVKIYPRMQIIEPALYHPIQAKDEQKQDRNNKEENDDA